MANRTFDTAGNFNVDTNWDGDTLPAAGDNLIIAANCTLTANETVTYGTITYSGTGVTLDMATYNLDCGAVTVSAGNTLVIGISAGTGLTCAGLTANTSTSVLNLNALAKVNNSGNLTIYNGQVFSSSGKGIYVQTGNGNMSNAHYTNAWRTFTINSGVTVTMASSCQLSGQDSTNNSCTINGTLACTTNSYIFYIQKGSSGTFTIGASGDITGTSNGQWNALSIISSTGITYSRATALSFSGNICFTNYVNAATLYIPSEIDFSNALLILNTSSTAGDGNTYIPTAGTLKCSGFISFNNKVGGTFTVDNSVNNPSFQIGGNTEGFNLKYSSVDGCTWTKGTGTITFTNTISVNLNGKTVEDIIVNASDKTITNTSNFTSDSITMTAGTFKLKNSVTTTITDFYGTGGNFQSDSSGTQAVLALTNISTCTTGVTFKDIDTTPTGLVPYWIYGGTNGGNNTGIKYGYLEVYYTDPKKTISEVTALIETKLETLDSTINSIRKIDIKKTGSMFTGYIIYDLT